MMHVRKLVSTTLVLMIGAQSALAAASSGYAALAFGTLVGGYSPDLITHKKALLSRLLDGKTGPIPVSSKITIKADAVICHAGNVDIAAFGCKLTFGKKTVTLSGRRANELFATIGEIGVASDGAAGSIYEALHNVNCTIDPALVMQKDGGGADCSFDPGPT